ncbi:MAG: M66 family metalloprotease [Gammaproteobacteria bacterium]|nr:M66 family metalloprotease [Gammaproteobacteria bacterium]
MKRRRSRVWVLGFYTALLAVCSDDPAPTAPTPPHPPSPPEQSDATDRAALIALFDATGGPTNWRDATNWNTSESIDRWHGVSTNLAGFVTELSLPGNNLSGTLPPELGDLTHLRWLVLSGNELTGAIPAELGNLEQLRELVPDNNELAGTIPVELGNLEQLRRLVLDNNELTGAIPPALAELSQLTLLDLTGNSLHGTIPAALGAMPRLDSLLLGNNELSGPIPAELGGLVALRRLRLSWNQLTGAMPPELGRLTNLTYLSVSRNQLTGPIPTELAGLSAIRFLSVSRNNLTGAIPSGLGDLTTLQRLYLYDNELTGEIPVSLVNLSELVLLWIHENGLSGPLPEEFANLAALQDLRVAGNGLSGGLPRGLGQLQALTRVELDGNHDLAGLLPRSMLDLRFLRDLSYGATGLCAQIDDEFQKWLRRIPDGDRTDCDVAQVERLALTGLHDVTGGPSWANRAAWGTDAPLGDWHGVATEGGRVVQMALPANGLSGPLPAEIANLLKLTVLDLTANGLSGAFPGTIAALPELAELRVGRNAGLEGALPFALRRLDRVRVLRYDDTGLCASPSPNFQAWFTAIGETAGAICDNAEEVTVSMPMVYLTQSVQTPSGSVRLVANREALLRAFVTAEQPGGFFEPEVVAVFAGPEGDEVHRVAMTRHANQIPTEADEGDLELSYNAVIPGEIIVPGVEMIVEVDPEGAVPFTVGSETRFPSQGTALPNVVVVPPMQLALVPVITTSEPDTSVLSWVRGISADISQLGLLKHAFPFAEFSVSPREPYYTSLNLTSTAGQVALFGELEAVRASEGGTGYYYGVVAHLGGAIGGRGQRPGWVSIGVRSPNTLAHEVGHNLSLRHAPCGGPAGVDPDYPYPDGGIGVWGYDFRNGLVLPPDHSKDIMTYCGTLPWLSDYHFQQVIDHRAGLAAGAANAGLAASNPPSDMLVLWGGMVDEELWIEPVFAMRAAAGLPGEPGPYRIRGTGSDGQPLFSLDFTPTEDGHGGRHFFFTVPIDPGWENALERITLTGPEGVAYLDQDDERRITVVTEPGTGRLRAILRDCEGALPDMLRDAAGLEVSMTRGLKEAVRLRR